MCKYFNDETNASKLQQKVNMELRFDIGCMI